MFILFVCLFVVYSADSEEEVATKKSKSNPTKGAMIPKTKSPKTPAKAKEIKSVSDFFGSAPIKRSSEIISRSPGTSGGKGNRLEKRELSKNGKQGEDVVVIPESPTDMAGFEFDDEAIAMALQEDEMEGRKVCCVHRKVWNRGVKPFMTEWIRVVVETC